MTQPVRTAKVVSYPLDYVARHAGELNPARDAKLFEEAAEVDERVLGEIKRRVSVVHRATSEAYAAIGLPLPLRPLVSVLLAASDGRDTFPASYKTLVELLFRDGDGRKSVAKKSHVRRLLKQLRTWQDNPNNPTLCTIRGGGKVKKTGGGDEYHDTEFELVFLKAIAKAVARDPDPNKMRGVVRQAVYDDMRKVLPFDARWSPKVPTEAQKQANARKAAISLAVKGAKAARASGGDAFAYLERLAEDMRVQLEADLEAEATPPGAPPQFSESVDGAEDDGRGGVSDATHPPRPNPAPSLSLVRVADSLAEDPPVEHTPQAVAAFDALCERVKYPPRPGSVVELPLGGCSEGGGDG